MSCSAAFAIFANLSRKQENTDFLSRECHLLVAIATSGVDGSPAVEINDFQDAAADSAIRGTIAEPALMGHR
jgi:hypothetical protein